MSASRVPAAMHQLRRAAADGLPRAVVPARAQSGRALHTQHKTPTCSLGASRCIHAPFSTLTGRRPAAVLAASSDLVLQEDADEFEDLEEIDVVYGSATEELLSHRSFQMTTVEDWDDCVGQEDEGEDEAWDTVNTKWLFAITAQSEEGGTWHQYILDEQGLDAGAYLLGQRLAMWDGRDDFVSLSRVVHLRDQFQFLSLAYDRATESAQAREAEPPAGLDVEALLKDIEALSTTMQLQAAYPVKFFGSSRGSDLLPCMFQLPPATPLAPKAVWDLFGIDPKLAAQFPKPVAFATSDDFAAYMRKRVAEWQRGWGAWLEAKAVEGLEVEEELAEYLAGGPQFEELLERALAFADYVEGPILEVVAGSGELNMDPVPFFWLGASPSDSSRVLGMTGAIWYRSLEVQLPADVTSDDLHP